MSKTLKMHAFFDADRDAWRLERQSIDAGAVATGLLGEAAKRSGGRLWWRCPFHEERTPSFAIETKPGGGWRCFGCGEKGDAAGLLMRLRGMTFPEARAALTGRDLPTGRQAGGRTDPARRPFVARQVGKTGHASSPKKPPGVGTSEPDGACRHDEFAALIDDAAARLWAPEGVDALAELRGRGLSDDVIRATSLGYTPRAAGVPWNPPGVVIPYLRAARVVWLKVRASDGWRGAFPEANRPPKYIGLKQPCPGLYPGPEVIRAGRAVVVVEGELDALCLTSVLGDAAAVVTLGGASAGPTPEALRCLLGASPWLLALDGDAAGDRAAAGWPERARRVRPPEPHKDWCDAYRAEPAALLRFWADTLGRPDLLSTAHRLRVLWPALLADPYTAEERTAIQSEAANASAPEYGT
jgi:DNA primase